MKLPPLYQRRLQKAYPDVRMRWSDTRQAWQFEIRANYRRLDIDPAKYPAHAVDTFICHQDGYYRECEYPPDGLPPIDRFIQFLRKNDVRRMGYGPNDGDKLADMLDERDAAWDAVSVAATRRKFVESGADLLMDMDRVQSVVPDAID